MKIIFLSKVERKFNGETINQEPLGGTHSVLIQLSRELVKLGNDITIFCNCSEEGIFAGVNYLNLNKIINYTKENDVDIFVAVACESALKIKIRAKKTIAWLHNDYSPYWHGELSDIASNISKYLAVNSDKVVTVSKWQTNKISETFKIPLNHFSVINNGIDSSFFSKKINRNKNKLIYTSVPDRGLDLLLEYFPELKEKYTDLELHVFSSFSTWGIDKKKYQKIESEIFAKNKSTDVFFHKPLTITKLANKLLESSIFVYPNKAAEENFETYAPYETFSMSVLEAQAAGLPVISSKRGGIPEVIKDKKSGFLIDLEPSSEEYKEEFINRVSNILEDENLWKELSNNAINNVQENFEINKIAKKWHSLFQNLLSENEITKLTEPPLKAKYDKPLVSIIVPTYNRARNLPYLLDSLIKQNFKSFEVIISDDGSTDNTKKIIEEYRNKLNLRYTYCGENKGFRAARTRNIGLKKARGELIIFTDSDLVVPNNYIEAHIKTHQKHDEIAVNSCVYRIKEEGNKDIGLEPNLFIPKYIDHMKHDKRLKYNLFDKPEPFDEGYFLDSNSLSIKAKHIKEIGFDESFVGWGHEDTELGYSLTQIGLKFVFIKKGCESYHLFHYISPEKEKEAKENWQRLAKKHKLENWYEVLHDLDVISNVKINNFNYNKGFMPCLSAAKFKIKIGEKVQAYKEIELDDNGFIRKIE